MTLADATTILIPVDNRLFGWGMNDLTLYGTQPAPGMVIGRAADPGGGAIAPVPDAVGAGTAPDRPTEADAAAGDTTALLDDAANQPSATPVPLSQVMPSLGEGQAAHGSTDQASVPQPLGSGSFVDAPLATPLQAAAGDQTAADGSPLTPGAVVADLAPVAPIVADAGGTADALAGTLAQSLFDAVGTIQTLVPDAGVPDAGVLSAIPSILGDVGGSDAVIDTIPLSSFAGADPLGGITTLVGMVESSDAFDLGQAVTPGTEASGSILDSLVDDAAPPMLLGDEHGDEGHILDDHGIHLGL